MRIPRKNGSTQSGLTMFGFLTVLAVSAVVSSFIVSGVVDYIHKERMERCLKEMRSIQATLWPLWKEGTPIDPGRFWSDYWAGHKPGPYHYIPNTDVETIGHGYDLIGCDRSRTTGPPCMDFRFVVVCSHEHGARARYVYVVDQNPPALASEENDPRYDQLIDTRDERSDLAGRGSL